MKKYMTLFLMLMTMLLAGCAENAVLDNSRIYEVGADIESLIIKVGAADLSIKHAESFSVESNLKYLSVSEENGVLAIIDKKTKGVTYDSPILTLYMPENIMFNYIDISTGTAKLTVDSLSARSLKLQLGAGDVYIKNLNAESNADIEGGAGKVTIDGGTMNDLALKMGVGELNLTAVLQGNSDLTFGVGESNITLIGDVDDYRLDIEKGLGSLTVDGKNVADFEGDNDGCNRVRIEGGIGAINLEFQEEIERV